MTKMTKEEINNKYNELLDLNFLSLHNKDEFSAYFDLNKSGVRLCINLLNGRMFWFTMPPQTYIGFTFEEVLNSVTDEIKTEMLFHLDLFR